MGVEMTRYYMFLPNELRVPLDVQRPCVTSLPWYPVNLSDTCVSSQVGLLKYLRFCKHINEHTEYGVSPLLVDINIFYRIMKMSWSAAYGRWDIATLLRGTPPCFGLWHAYKFCVTLTCRKLHSAMWYCIRGSLPVGEQVPTAPPLRSMELTLAVIMQVPSHVRKDVCQVATLWKQLRDNDTLVYELSATSTGVEQETRVTVISVQH